MTKPRVAFTDLLTACLFISLFIVLYKADVFSFLTGSIPLWDFDAYWTITQAVISGQHPYELSSMQTLGPPVVLIPFLLFAWLPLENGRQVFSIILIVASLAMCWLLATSTQWTTKARRNLVLFLAVILFSSFPTRFSLLLGQPIPILTLCLLVFLQPKKTWYQAVGLASAIILKTQFIFLGLSLLRAPRVLGMTLSILAIVLIFCAPVILPRYYGDYLTKKVGVILVSTNQATDLDYYNQSLKATLQRLKIGRLYLPIFATLFVIAIYHTAYTQSPWVAICWSLILSPVSWQHYFVVLFPVLFQTAQVIVRQKNTPLLIGWAIAASLWWIELPWLHTAPVTLITGLLASHYFASAVFCLVICSALDLSSTRPHS